MSKNDPLNAAKPILEAIADVALESGLSVAVAESLTGGQIATHLAAVRQSSDWFRGGIVAYHREVKFELLKVPEGPVVNAATAEIMARSTRELLGADVTVSVTGSGGPEEQDGQPAGTVFIAGSGRSGYLEVERFQLDGDVDDILTKTIVKALEILLQTMRAEAEQ